ncbi:MAG: GGDEF domain-containing protein [Desulfotignum sp.]|nr:GGDEF domain-containing protein [Desulfotignum sp.]MCF8114694.1 GGDEF domain-containing protein [Desulfotignum sp.]MCF8139418.1 GGDEF domain-containing protein [Desulfotignum sp.]
MRLPLSLTAAAVILVVTMTVGSYVDLRNDEMHARHLVISNGLENIVRLNQELSAMLMISVLEKNSLRSSSYQTVYDKLELTVNTVEKELAVNRIEKWMRQLDLANDISALSLERRELRRVELAVIELMEAEQWPEARALLFDESYVLARKIYEINSETAINALNGELAAVAATFKHVRLISLVVRAAALGLLLWAGLMFSRRLRQELAEQARLREKISVANIRLEDNVRERTAELEEANRKLADLSATDGLTGLANRRRFDEALNSEWQRAMRLGLPLAVAMIDVDQFKLYNDHFGHQAGDQCLRRIAAVLRTCIHRSGDLIARYGGEEFVIILPGLSADKALILAETIRNAVQAEHLLHTKQSNTGVITVSIGIAARSPKPGQRADDLLREADTAMYEAKRRGRNLVVACHRDEFHI